MLHFHQTILLRCCIVFILSSSMLPADEYQDQVQPLLQKYCFECHAQGEDSSGELDLSVIKTNEQVTAAFEKWETALELIEAGEMPPEDAKQPTDVERKIFSQWYQKKFVETVTAKPGRFKSRRLSAHEYRNTMRSLFGFDLEVDIIEAEQTVVEKSMVMKLMPTDPMGDSGFRNDTHNNPLTTLIWDQYSYLADKALEEMFSRRRRKQLEKIVGPLEKTGITSEQAEILLRNFVPRAYRRDVPEKQLQQMVSLVRNSDDIEAALKIEMKAVLMSPGFMFRGVLMPKSPGPEQAVDDFELAERLSYFLWADMPDQRLLDLAAQGKLSDPSVLQTEVDRMIASPKTRNLAEDLAEQWFSLNEIDKVSNNVPVAVALRSQPEDFFHYLVSENRPLLELIDSKVAFTNPFTRRYYGKDSNQLPKYSKQRGIEVEIVVNHKIILEETTERGGILTMPGIVAMNKGPVLRGTWILERILGDHLPDPPADVGVVKPNSKGENLTFRQRFEQHRSNKTCAVCHDKIDPLGFALQGYDNGGGYILAKNYATAQKNKKDKTKASNQIDTSGKLPSGEAFDDFQGLKKILVTSQRTVVIRNIVKKMLSYALCRQLELHDQPTVENMVKKLDQQNGTYHDLIHEIVNSLPFQKAEISGDQS